MSIQEWSKEGSTTTAVARPWTCIFVCTDTPRLRYVIHTDAPDRASACDFFCHAVDPCDHTIVAVIFGHHDPKILHVLGSATRAFAPREA